MCTHSFIAASQNWSRTWLPATFCATPNANCTLNCIIWLNQMYIMHNSQVSAGSVVQNAHNFYIPVKLFSYMEENDSALYRVEVVSQNNPIGNLAGNSLWLAMMSVPHDHLSHKNATQNCSAWQKRKACMTVSGQHQFVNYKNRHNTCKAGMWTV